MTTTTYNKILSQFQSASPIASSVNVSGIEEFNLISDICNQVAENLNEAYVFRFNFSELLKPVFYKDGNLVNLKPEALEDYINSDETLKAIYAEYNPDMLSQDPIGGLCSLIIHAANVSVDSGVPQIWILQDIHHTLGGEQENPRNVRFFKTLLHRVHKSRVRLIFTGLNVKLSDDFNGMISHFSEIIPSNSEIMNCIHETIENLAQDGRFTINLDIEQNKQALTRKCAGLTLSEVANVIRYSCRYHECELSDKLLVDIQEYKIEKLRKAGIEFADSPDSEIGGLNQLKTWVNRRKRLFDATLENQDLNLPTPKGLFLVGVPGTGKSLAAKAIGQLYNIPVAKLDISAVFNSLVGESEKAIKSILTRVDSIAPCILWIDEIEKLFSGNGNGNDSGVGNRIFGQFLTWMQEKSSGVFVVATANSIDNLPPELLRKGRFDEVFFLDIPNSLERAQIIEHHLSRYNVTIQDLTGVLSHSEGFVGAEIASAIDEAVLIAFDIEESLNVGHLITAFSETVPMSKFNAEKIQKLRAWGNSHARIANTLEQAKPSAKTRKPAKTNNMI